MAKRERRSGACGRSVFGMACAMGLAALLSSCMHDDTPPCEMSPEDGYTLNVRLSAGSLATRAAEDGTSPGTGAENFINIGSGDYAVFILDQDGHYVQRFEPGSVSLKTTAQGDVYDLRGFFRPAETMTSIQLMVAANWETDFGYSYNDFESVLKKMDTDVLPTLPERIYDEDINFTLPTNGGTSWVPVAGEGRVTGIPMFGMMSAPVALDRSSMTTEIPAAIPMLRSLAKIEIRDMVEGKSAEIERCVLTKYNTKGRFIPDGKTNSDWNVAEKQVLTPSLPSDAAMTGTGLQFAKEKRDVTINGTDYKGDKAKDYFVVYVPEIDLTKFAEDERPVIEVYLKDATEPSAVIQLADYNGGKEPEREDGQDPYYKNLLRNHAYRYDVTGVGLTAELELVIVSHWEEGHSDEWDFEDVRVTFADAAGVFKWGTTKPDHEDIDQRTMIISQDEWLEGSFKLSQPAKGFWTLALISDDDTANDRFRIDTGIQRQLTDESGNPVYDTGQNGEQIPVMTVDWTPGSGSVSGYIDPASEKNNVLFRIIPIGTNNDVIHYTARVVMTCTTFDGQMIEVNLPYFVGNSGNLTDSENMPPPTVATKGYYYVKQYYTGFGGYDDDLEEDVAEDGTGDENTGN